MQRGNGFAVDIQLIADLRQLVKCHRFVFHLRQTAQEALQIKAQILVNPISIERRFRHGAGDQAGKIEPPE